MSRAFPSGSPSMMSVRTMSAILFCASQCAVAVPTAPAPMMDTFGRAIPQLPPLPGHVLDDRRGELAGPHLSRAVGEPRQIVGHDLLLESPLQAAGGAMPMPPTCAAAASER